MEALAPQCIAMPPTLTTLRFFRAPPMWSSRSHDRQSESLHPTRIRQRTGLRSSCASTGGEAAVNVVNPT